VRTSRSGTGSHGPPGRLEVVRTLPTWNSAGNGSQDPPASDAERASHGARRGSGPAASGTRDAEAAVRDRWRERRLRGRPDPPRDTTAPTFVIHGTPAAGEDVDGTRLGALVAADVLARHAAMGGARVENVAAHQPSPDAEAVRRRLACDDDDARRHDTAAPSYVDSLWWAVDQLWHAGLLHERSVPATGCEHCDTTTPAPTSRPAGALVRFPVTGDGALHTAGASLLVSAHVTALADATTVALSPDVDRVLAQAEGDAYPVVVPRAVVPQVLGDDAVVHRHVGVEELLAATCRHPLDDRAAPLTVVAAPHADRDGAVGASPLPPAPRGKPAAAGDRADGSADRADDLLVELRERGLLLGREPGDGDATTCAACGAVHAPVTRTQWVVTTARWGAQLREEHARVARHGARPVAPWALGDEEWVVTAPPGPGAPLPLWRCDRCEAVTVIPGRSELATLADRGAATADPTDDVVACATFPCDACGDGTAHRVPLTLDRRVVAAAMPFARFGFPAVPGSDGRVARRHHADVIVDDPSAAAADATLTLATLLWGAGSHDTLLSVADPDLAATDVLRMCDLHGADAVRWAILDAGGQHDGQGLDPSAWRARHEIVAPLRHACTLVCRAAEDLGLPSADAVRAGRVDTRDVWDRWLLAELCATVDEVRARLAAADPGGALPQLRRAVARLEAWFGHRDLGRTGSASDADALATAHEYLVTLAALLAPYMPVVADELYEALVRSGDPAAPDSIHLLRFPVADPRARDDDLRDRVRAHLTADDRRSPTPPQEPADTTAGGDRSTADGPSPSDAPRHPAVVW
jgi:isoleucyl-tRNA synthetase